MAEKENPMGKPSFDERVVLEAERHFREHGYAIFENCLPVDLLADLQREYLPLFNAKVARQGLRRVAETRAADASVKIDFQPRGGNHDINRWNMHLPSRKPFLDSRLIANPNVVEVLRRLFGQEPALAIIASDTPLQGSVHQSIHQDVAALWVTLNVPLVDCTEENGALEIWPDTHRPRGDFRAMHRLSERQIRALTERRPGRRMLLPAGAFLLRDQRLLHRGTPNITTSPRPMLNLFYLPPPVAPPHRQVANGAARIALEVRERVRRSDDVEGLWRVLDTGNTMGRLVELFSGTDRDYRRRVPADLWEEMTPDAKSVLRFAEVDGRRTPATTLGTGLLVGHLLADGLAFLRRRFSGTGPDRASSADPLPGGPRES